MDPLRQGRGIEQLVRLEKAEGGRLLWVSISVRRGRRFGLRVHHVKDEGSPSFFDVHEFSPVDDDEPIGEGRLVAEFDDAEAAIRAAEDFGASMDRWVNEGVIDAEYADKRRDRAV